MIGLLGAKGSGKTVLMTVLVRQLREVGLRFDADIRIATENPDGYQALSDYRSNREIPLFEHRVLPVGTTQLAMRAYATPVVLRWRRESRRRFGRHDLRSTMLSLVDTAGEDLNDLDTAFILAYTSVCDGLIITLDPFALPGARARLDLPEAAIQVDPDVPFDVISRITELIRTERNVKGSKRINTPVAIAVTKMDAFYQTLDRNNPIMAMPRAMPFYDDIDGQAVHEHTLSLLHEWNASDIDRHLQLNYSNFRYFAISALGAEPDYMTGTLAPGGVQPHRVEDPVLWLMSKFGTVPRS